jgi:enoyl-CoA hydratase
MTSSMSQEHDVLIDVEGTVGRIIMNRPRARNALTIQMADEISAALTQWSQDSAIRAVVINGAGEHGLCAGGDVRAMRAGAIAGDGGADKFFRAEYRLNSQISHFPKPFIAMMDGLTMGGGIGLSAHGRIRIVTERSKLAMPEVTIGLAPDIGASWLLSRAPGELGTYAALTGVTMTASDGLRLGLADHYLPSNLIGEFIARLVNESSNGNLDEVRINDLLGDLTRQAPDSAVAAASEWIDACFVHDTVEEILAALDAHGGEAQLQTASTIREKSPRALKVTLESLRRARGLGSLDEALEQEFNISCALMSSHDAIEGIRALIVDKDRNPKWEPASLAEVDHDLVEAAFAPGPLGSLGLFPKVAS